jgi:thioredoxin-dependent peroxiredoxin
VRDEISQYQQLNVRPFGVNPAAPDKHAGYAARLQLPFVLLSDPGEAIAKAYHAVRPWGSGITRTVYLVGTDGRILYGARGAPGPDISLVPLMDASP